jgi:hypothetical protein
LPGLKGHQYFFPARLAWFPFCSLITGITVLIPFDSAGIRTGLIGSSWRLILLVVACTFCPLLHLFCGRSLMKGDISKYPDIDDAWKSGMHARQGLS